MKSNKQLFKFLEKSLSCIQSLVWKKQDLAGVFMIVHFNDTGSRIDFRTVTAVKFFSDLRENVFKSIMPETASDEHKERFWFHVMNLLVKNGSICFLDPIDHDDGRAHHIGYIYITADELDSQNNSGYIADIIKKVEN